tara:strand:+ start:232 stop:570 length:339 start_codon:yes stop_codon:yes gene_type:complete
MSDLSKARKDYLDHVNSKSRYDLGMCKDSYIKHLEAKIEELESENKDDCESIKNLGRIIRDRDSHIAGLQNVINYAYEGLQEAKDMQRVESTKAMLLANVRYKVVSKTEESK